MVTTCLVVVNLGLKLFRLELMQRWLLHLVLLSILGGKTLFGNSATLVNSLDNFTTRNGLMTAAKKIQRTA